MEATVIRLLLHGSERTTHVHVARPQTAGLSRQGRRAPWTVLSRRTTLCASSTQGVGGSCYIFQIAIPLPIKKSGMYCSSMWLAMTGVNRVARPESSS